jgi:transposase
VCGLGIDVHQDFYVVVKQVDATNPKPAQRFGKQAFLHWATKLKQSGAEVHAVYEACGFGFSLQRQLAVLGIHCHVFCPQKLDERNKRVKTDRLDAKALCLKLDRFVQGNRDALAIVRVPTEEEERSRTCLGTANPSCSRYRKRSPSSRCNCKALPLPINRANWAKCPAW